MSGLFESFFEQFQRIEEIFIPLSVLTSYLNMSTELPAAMKANRNEWLWMKGRHQQLEAKAMHPDMTPIVLENFGFCYNSVWYLRNVCKEVPQGGLIAVTGAHGSGRANLLKMLAKLIFPQEGNVFAPTHLRRLFVSLEPIILTDITLWENLTFGCPFDVDPVFVTAILRKLGMTKVLEALRYFGGLGGLDRGASLHNGREEQELHNADSSNPSADTPLPTPRTEENRSLLGHFPRTEEELFHKGTSLSAWLMGDDLVDREQARFLETRRKELGAWFHRLNHTEKVKIHLARAFIMNPEIMLLHRPLLHFGEDTSKFVLTLLKEHLESRGLGHSMAGRDMRRPRTVFYSTDFDWQANSANVIWHVDHETKNVVEKRPLDPMIRPDSTGSRFNLVEKQLDPMLRLDNPGSSVNLVEKRPPDPMLRLRPQEPPVAQQEAPMGTTSGANEITFANEDVAWL